MQMNEFGSFFLILFLFVLPFVLADLQVDFYKSGTDLGFRDGGPEDKQKIGRASCRERVLVAV